MFSGASVIFNCRLERIFSGSKKTFQVYFSLMHCIIIMSSHGSGGKSKRETVCNPLVFPFVHMTRHTLCFTTGYNVFGKRTRKLYVIVNNNTEQDAWRSERDGEMVNSFCMKLSAEYSSKSCEHAYEAENLFVTTYQNCLYIQHCSYSN